MRTKEVLSRVLVWCVLGTFMSSLYATARGPVSSHAGHHVSQQSTDAQAKAKLLAQLNRFASNADHGFQSQASNGGLGVGVSINPATLSLDFNQKITQVHASGISSFGFPLSIVSGKDYNPDNALLDIMPPVI